MDEDDLDLFTRGLTALVKDDGRKMAQLSKIAGLNESFIRDLIRKKSSPKVSNAYAVAAALGETIDNIISIGISGNIHQNRDSRTTPYFTPVIAKVGAGDLVPLSDAYEMDGLFKIATPAQMIGKNVVGVSVSGGSMEPLYFDGDILFFTRRIHSGVSTDDIGHPCISADSNNMAWVKIIKPNKQDHGRWNLISINEQTPTMVGVEIKWASRVLLSLSRDLVESVHNYK